MEVIHDGMGHPGSTRCLATTRLRYHWKYMRRDIGKYIEECQFCKIRKSYCCKPNVPIQEYPEVSLPMQRIHMDLTGMLPTTEGEGNKYILVIKDFKTKYVWLYPIQDKTASTVVKIVMEDLIPFWGAPEIIVTDKGTEFKNQMMREVTELLNIEKINSTTSNPRANEIVEKHNNTMKDMLYHFTNERHNNWDQSVRLVAMLYNSSVNVNTGYTPYYLMFGREMNMVDDVKVQMTTSKGEYAEDLSEALSLAWEVTTDREHFIAKRDDRKKENKNKLVELFTTIKRGDLEKIQSEASQLQHLIKRTYEFREYEIGDMFYRKRHPIRAFKSAGEKEKWKYR
jgi:transposase InsO family protein